MIELYKCQHCGHETIKPIIEREYTNVGERCLCYETYFYCPRCNGDLKFLKYVIKECEE